MNGPPSRARNSIAGSPKFITIPPEPTRRAFTAPRNMWPRGWKNWPRPVPTTFYSIRSPVTRSNWKPWRNSPASSPDSAGVDFELTAEQRNLRDRCLELATDFATRSAEHDRDASHPVENYDRLRKEGFLHLTVPKAWGGSGFDFLTHTIAYEALGRGCPSTALAFNMHASVVMPILESDEVTIEAKQRLADLVVRQGKMLGGNFSETGHTSLIGERPLSVRAHPVSGGYRITGRKMFASMI